MIALSLLVFASTVGYRYVSAHYSCQNCTEDLLYPCVRQFGRAPLMSALQKRPEYQALWTEKRDTIPCAAVSQLPIVENGQAWRLQKYLHAALSSVLLTTGPRYAGFHYFMTGMFALTSLAAYGVLRLGMGRIVAAGAAVMLIGSELHQFQTTNVADYAKAPFMLASLFFVGLALGRPVSRRRLIALALMGGAIAGIGIGFKADVLVCGPIFAAAIMLFLPPSTDGRYRRLTATAVFLASLIVAGGPMLVTNFFGSSGSLLPVQVFGGMDRSADDLVAAPAPYDYGIVFDDDYVTLQINSYNQRVYNSREMAWFFNQGMAKAGWRILVDTERVFPADRIVRVLGGVFRVLALEPYGLSATVIVLVALYATSLRWGSCVTFLLLTYVGYASLVFIPRHYFHLLIVPLWMIGFVLHHGAAAAGRWLRPVVPGLFEPAAVTATPFERAAGVRGVGILVALCLAVWTLLTGARAYQHSRVQTLIEGYNREENFSTVQVAPASAQGGRIRLDVIGGLAQGSFGASDRNVLAANYLVVDVECTAPSDSTIVTAYQRPESWLQPTRVRCSTGSRHWRLFLPTYDFGQLARTVGAQGPEVHVRGLEWNSADPIRVLSVRKVRDLDATPLLIKLALPDDWRSQPLYHEFSLAALERRQPL